jgi:xanthine dehydrogenase YagR molybdenum-binding subunit
MAETPQTGIVPQRRHGASIGQPLTRRDGLLKVTGRARYAADNHPPRMPPSRSAALPAAV